MFALLTLLTMANAEPFGHPDYLEPLQPQVLSTYIGFGAGHKDLSSQVRSIGGPEFTVNRLENQVVAFATFEGIFLLGSALSTVQLSQTDSAQEFQTLSSVLCVSALGYITTRFVEVVTVQKARRKANRDIQTFLSRR